jgi:hypothetical protein
MDTYDLPRAIVHREGEGGSIVAYAKPAEYINRYPQLPGQAGRVARNNPVLVLVAKLGQASRC